MIGRRRLRQYWEVPFRPIEFVAGASKKDPDRDAGETIDPVDQTTEVWSEDHSHPKTIPRSFAISTSETRFEQMQKFDPDFHRLQNKTLGPTLQHPACKVTWYHAAAYCNWLSKMAEIAEDQWCFVPNAEGKYAEGMSLAPNYLQRTGFRLPTEAEWEYACRAGTNTRRYFGESDELITRYAWYLENSHEKLLLVPGTQLPNELGLFDMLGNVMEWCLDEVDRKRPESRFRQVDDEFTELVISEGRSNLLRILRGSSIWDYATEVRASEFSAFLPSYREGNTGFRVARTEENFTANR